MYILGIIVAIWMLINVFIPAFTGILSSMGWFFGGAFILLVLCGLLKGKK